MSRTRDVLKEYGYRPRKQRGQNFLVRETVLRDIAKAAALRPDETVIEIGPGPGNLTRRLLPAVKKVIAIEIEPELASILKAELPADNLSIVVADVLDLDFGSLAPEAGRLKVVANLPYNITTPVLFKLLKTPALFSELLLLLQQEVAERIVAAPGRRAYGILAVQTQLLADASIALRVGPEAFHPKPKVSSALLRLKMLPAPRVAVADLELFQKVVRAAFARRRKTLRNSFSETGLELPLAQVLAAMARAGIDPGRRAETVAVEEFAALANILAGGDRA